MWAKASVTEKVLALRTFTEAEVAVSFAFLEK